MASANLDLVLSIYAAWGRGHFSSTDWAHPEIELVVAGGPAPGCWTGLAGLAEGYRTILGASEGWRNAWEGWRAEAEEYLELDGDRVLVLTCFKARGKMSELEVARMQARAATLFHLGGGKVTGLVVDFDRERALAELGLAPQAGAPRA